MILKTPFRYTNRNIENIILKNINYYIKLNSKTQLYIHLNNEKT